AVAIVPRKRVSPGLDAWRRFRRHRLALASAGILSLIALTVALGPLFWQVPINDIDFGATLSVPSWQHPFGTDDLGQDIFARVLYGGRLSLPAGGAPPLVAVLVGPLIRPPPGPFPGVLVTPPPWRPPPFPSPPPPPPLLLLC